MGLSSVRAFQQVRAALVPQGYAGRVPLQPVEVCCVELKIWLKVQLSAISKHEIEQRPSLQPR